MTTTIKDIIDLVNLRCQEHYDKGYSEGYDDGYSTEE